MNGTIKRNILVNGEPFSALVTTQHGQGITARTLLHDDSFERSIGGARFVAAGDTSELVHLAKAMTMKCAAANIPAGGQKTLVVAPPSVIADVAARASILCDHIRFAVARLPGLIFGPDINNPEAVMDRVARSEGMLDSVTGLSEMQGGYGIDRNGITAVGVVEAIHTWARLRRTVIHSATVQGFGAVGAHTARQLHADGIPIVGICNIRGTISTDDPCRLPIDQLFQAWRRGGDDAVAAAAKQLGSSIKTTANPRRLLTIPADLVMPAARTSCLATASELSETRTENPAVLDVTEFFLATGVRVIAEGANHPLTPKAERYLRSQGVDVLPDHIINCGGLIACWDEWQARRLGIRTHDAKFALDRIRATVRENVSRVLQAPGRMRWKPNDLRRKEPSPRAACAP